MARPGSAVTAIVVAAGLIGCGGGTDEDGPRAFSTIGGIEVAAEGAADRRIAADFASYVAWPDETAAADFRIPSSGSTSEGVPYARIRRYYERRFGSLGDFRRAVLRVRGSYQRVEASEGVLTIETSLRHTAPNRLAARELICNAVQGSDAADFMPGHTVLASDGNRLVGCPARED
jgi:hypothetical protein